MPPNIPPLNCVICLGDPRDCGQKAFWDMMDQLIKVKVEEAMAWWEFEAEKWARDNTFKGEK